MIYTFCFGRDEIVQLGVNEMHVLRLNHSLNILLRFSGVPFVFSLWRSFAERKSHFDARKSAICEDSLVDFSQYSNTVGFR